MPMVARFESTWRAALEGGVKAAVDAAGVIVRSHGCRRPAKRNVEIRRAVLGGTSAPLEIGGNVFIKWSALERMAYRLLRESRQNISQACYYCAAWLFVM